MSRSAREVAAVGLLAAAVFVAGTFLRSPWRTDEHRYLEVSRQIGVESWLIPYINGDVYLEKPPGFFWLVAGVEHAGIPIERAALLPSALAAALTVAAAFAMGRRLFGAWAGVAAAVVLSSAEMFASLALRANLDAVLTASTTGALLAAVHLDPSLGPVTRRRAWALFGGLCAGFGVLVKGPVAWGVPAVVIVVHRLVTAAPRGGAATGEAAPPEDRTHGGRIRRLRDPALGLMAAVSLAVPLAWLAAASVEGGLAYPLTLFWDKGVGHPLGDDGKLRPWYYYAKSVPGSFAPWTVWLPAALAWGAQRARRSAAAGFALVWAVAPVLLLSVFPAKRHLYALPVLPGLALLVGAMLGAALSSERRTGVTWPVGRFGLAAVALVVGTTLVAAIVLELAGLQRVLERIAPIWGELAPAVPVLVPLAGLASGVALLVFGVATFRRPTPAGQARAALGIGAATAALFVFVAHPVESAGEDPALFYRRIQPFTAGRDMASYGGLDFSPLWMLSRQRVEMLPNREDAEAEIAPRTEALLLIGEARDVADLGRPCGARVLVRQPRPLGPELVLLEAFPEACPHPGPAAEARGSGR